MSSGAAFRLSPLTGELLFWQPDEIMLFAITNKCLVIRWWLALLKDHISLVVGKTVSAARYIREKNIIIVKIRLSTNSDCIYGIFAIWDNPMYKNRTVLFSFTPTATNTGHLAESTWFLQNKHNSCHHLLIPTTDKWLLINYDEIWTNSIDRCLLSVKKYSSIVIFYHPLRSNHHQVISSCVEMLKRLTFTQMALLHY